MRTTLLLAVLTSLALTGCASLVDQGVAHFKRGEYADAARKWRTAAERGDHWGQFNYGLVAEFGYGVRPVNLPEAGDWYLKSAQQGNLRAMVRLARLQHGYGHKKAAVSWLALAARNGHLEAISALKQLGEPVPPADLLEKRRAAEARATRENAALAGALLQGFAAGYGAGQPGLAGACSSDFQCGFGNRCVKPPFSSSGTCMREVDDYGIPTFASPSADSIGVRTDLGCIADVDCSIGFRCDPSYKACVRK